ncbi:MAG: hypothetical protein QW508_06640, partial [Conexivisphaerales archaeon]
LKNEKISQQSLYYQKKLIKNGKQLNFKTKVVKKLWNKYNGEKNESRNGVNQQSCGRQIMVYVR